MTFSFFKRRQSFANAIRGGRNLVQSQRNAWIHLTATVTTVAIAGVLGISTMEWLLIAIVIGMVWCAEALNTAIELLGDEISLERRERIGRAKDVAAFAVLVSALTAAIVGIVIFGRHLLALT